MPKRRLLKRTRSRSSSVSDDSVQQGSPKRRLRKCSEVGDEDLKRYLSSSSSSSSSSSDDGDGSSDGDHIAPSVRPERRRLSVSDVKGEFKLRRVIAKGGYNEAFSEDESFVNDDDYEEEEEEEESFINDDTSNEEESVSVGVAHWENRSASGEEGSDGGVVARYNLINEKMDEERQKKRQSAGLTVGAKIRSPEIAFHEYLEFLTVSMCEPDAEMNEKYAASVKRIEGELEQARSARSTTAWDAHGGRYRRGLDLYPDLISRPTQINEESTRLLRREGDCCLACNRRRWKLDARLNGRMCDSRRVWDGDIRYWYRSYGMTPLLSTGLEGGETPAQGLTSSDAEEDDEGVDEVRHWMLDNWFHLGKTCRKNSEDYQFLQHYKERLMFRIYVKLKNAVTIISRTEMALAILNRDDKNWKQWKTALFEEYTRVTDTAFNAAEYKRVRNELMVDKFGK